MSSIPEPGTFGPVTLSDIVRFAGAGGDFNPLHHDPDTAHAAGFDGPVAMGQFTAGLMAAWLTDWCGVENLRSLEVRFSAPLEVGETLKFTAKLAQEQPATGTALQLAASCGTRTILRGAARIRHTPHD